MRIGLYGGSFDPIHRGHVEPVLAARRTLDLDRVLYLPTAVPPHKSARTAPPRQRYVMVELALLQHPELRVWDAEMTPEPSYTIDTVERFRRERPNDQPVLLLGADSFVALPSWRRWRDLLAACELGILTRPGDPWREPIHPELRRALDDGRARRVDNPPIAASSTAIRRSLAADRPREPAEAPRLAESLDPAVLDYIRKYSLYR